MLAPTGMNNKISHAYRDLAIAFLVMQFIITLVRSLLKEAYGTDYISYLLVLFVPSFIIFFPLAIRVVVKIDATKLFIKLLVALFTLGILFRIIAVFALRESQFNLPLNIFSSILITAFLVLVIYQMTRNLFSLGSHLVEKLWASVCVYFMIGILFGTLNAILLLLAPNALGIPINHPVEIYLNGLVYSVNILSGFDPVFQNVSESIQMGAIMQSLLSNLFLVVLLGRLLGNTN